MKQENLIIEFYNGMKRKIRLLLPKGYKTSVKRYPVLYMFDGQNVISARDSYTGVTWGVREAMDDLQRQGLLEPMVIVAIDHAEEMRVQEYSPFTFEMEDSVIDGEGAIFTEFLIRRLIPWLEENYPVMNEPSGRFLAGSSMGALITAWTALEYPGFFSAYGVFSLCTWMCPEEFGAFLEDHGPDADSRYYIQVGTQEGLEPDSGEEDLDLSECYYQESLEFVDMLRYKGVPDDNIELRIGEGEWHSEEIWRKYMPEFLQWLQARSIGQPSIKNDFQAVWNPLTELTVHGKERARG